MSATDAAPPPKPPRRRRGNEFSPTPPPEGVTKTTPDQSPSHLATEKKEAASLIVGALARRAPPSPPKDIARQANGDIPLSASPSIARRKSENEEKRIEERDERKNGALVPFDYLTKEDKEEPSLADVSISEADNVFTGSGKSSCESSPENQKGGNRHQKATRSKPIALPRSAARKKGSLEDEDEEYDDERRKKKKSLSLTRRLFTNLICFHRPRIRRPRQPPGSHRCCLHQSSSRKGHRVWTTVLHPLT